MMSTPILVLFTLIKMQNVKNFYLVHANLPKHTKPSNQGNLCHNFAKFNRNLDLIYPRYQAATISYTIDIVGDFGTKLKLHSVSTMLS